MSTCGGEIHLNDIGTEFRCTIKDCSTVVDVSTVTTKELIFVKPSGERLTKTASFYTDGTDGIITYTSVSGDLNECGLWSIQGFVIIGTGEFHSNIRNFKVERNL